MSTMDELHPDGPPPEYGIFAYDPWGPERGEIFDHSGWSLVRGLMEESTLTVTHASTAENADYLRDARIRVRRRAPGDDTTIDAAVEWLNIRNGTLIPGGRSGDRLDPARAEQWTFVSIDALLYQAKIADATNLDHPETETGDLPAYQWAVGTNAGRMLQNRLQAAQARVGVDGLLWGQGIRWSFTLTNDSLGNPWVWTLTEPYELSSESSVGDLRDWLEAQGGIDWWWIARDGDGFEELVIVNAGTGNVDHSVRDTDTYLEVHDDAVQKAPETKDPTGIATHALVTGDEGLIGWAHNAEAVSPFGRREISVAATGLTDPAGIPAAARASLRAAQRSAESIRRDVAGSDPGVVWVDRDFELGDNLAVERGRDSTDTDDTDLMRSLQAVSAQVAVDAIGTLTGYVVYNSRQEQAVARLQRRLSRAVGGTAGGIGGQPKQPKRDTRQPTVPTGLTATAVNYADADNRGRGKYTLTLVDDGNAVPDPVTGVVAPLKRSGYAWEWKAADGDMEWHELTTTVGPRLVLTGFDVDVGDKFRTRTLSWTGVPSAYSAELTASVPSDQDPAIGDDLVVDAGHLNQDIRTRRVAGVTGAAWELVTGEYLLAVTAVGATVDYGRAGTNTNGRRGITPRYKAYADVETRLASGASGTARIVIAFYDAAGAVAGSPAPATVAATSSWATIGGLVDVPANAKTMAIRLSATALAGGAKLYFRNPNLDRVTIRTRIGDGEVITEKMADGAATTPKIADGAATEPKVGAGAITEPKHAENGVSRRALMSAGPGRTAAVGENELDTDSVKTSHLQGNLDVEGTVTTGSGLTVGGITQNDLDFPNATSIGAITYQNLAFRIPGVSNFTGSGTFIGTWAASSTRASKTAIRELGVDEARRLFDLALVTFRYRADWMREKTKRVTEPRDYYDRKTKKWRRTRRRVQEGRVDGRRHAGFFAEDVDAAGFEGVVSRDDEGKPVGIDYGKLTPYLLRLLKDHDERIIALEENSD